MKILKIISILSIVFLILGCEDKKEEFIKTEDKNIVDSKRWYSNEMAQKGKVVYSNNCAYCHGTNGEGVILPWNQKMDDGRYPPPPLNDDAHAWHHPIKALRFTINEGGKPIGGVMPAFKDKLSSQDVDNVIAHIQSFWSDPYYEEWLKKDGLNK